MSEINTTPLVDVMLVLLIVFMITIPVITHTVPVELPKVRNEATKTKPENINLSVNKEGQVFWNQSLVADNDGAAGAAEGGSGAQAAARSARARGPDDALRERRPRHSRVRSAPASEGRVHHRAWRGQRAGGQ